MLREQPNAGGTLSGRARMREAAATRCCCHPSTRRRPSKSRRDRSARRESCPGSPSWTCLRSRTTCARAPGRWHAPVFQPRQRRRLARRKPRHLLRASVTRVSDIYRDSSRRSLCATAQGAGRGIAGFESTAEPISSSLTRRNCHACWSCCSWSSVSERRRFAMNRHGTPSDIRLPPNSSR